MSEKYTKEMHEAYRKEQDEKAAREKEEAKERTEKEAARRAWLQDGGSRRAFERAWPELRDEARRKRIMQADTQARAAQRAAGVGRI